MSRPTSKRDLLHQSADSFAKLNASIDSFSDAEKMADFSAGTMNRNIRDVLAHLHHWHLLMSDWYRDGMAGRKPEMPAKGYTWKTVPDLNRLIWKKYQDIPLEMIRSLLQTSHIKLQDLIEVHSDTELFEKRKYQWTGTTSLGAYFISATSSHYDWAIKLIRRGKRK